MHHVQDPGIGNMFPGKYQPYDEGLKQDIFIRNVTGGVLVGQVMCQTYLDVDGYNVRCIHLDI